MIKSSILENVGNTPWVCIKIDEVPNVDLFIKLEGYNPTGSVKDRASAYILQKLLASRTIDANTTIIESTSGNFGVSLSAYCNYYGLNFIAVVDPTITSINEMLIRAHGGKVIKVSQTDQYGGFLLSRIAKIKELQKEIHNCYWVNQYENPLNLMAYYESLGDEICNQLERIDYVFLGVSSGGTIAGVSKKVKERYPGAKIIAVDVEGSMIFTGCAKKRYIPGIGSSMVPNILKDVIIDEITLVDEMSSIRQCHELLTKECIYVGGSSGSVLAGIKQYFQDKEIKSPVKVVTIFPDRGERYFDTIYNDAWCQQLAVS